MDYKKMYHDSILEHDSYLPMFEKLTDENEELKKEIKKLKQYKYDRRDWSYGYGFTVKDGEYRICMAGGGDHWFDYVMTKNGCFIDNENETKKVKTFVSCPEGNYIKVVSVGEDYSPDDGETDMYEIVQECYEEEIMDYEDDQYYRLCGWCKEQDLGINEHIYIYEKKGEESKCLCKECGEPNPYDKSPYSILKKEGYTCDEDEDNQ